MIEAGQSFHRDVRQAPCDPMERLSAVPARSRRYDCDRRRFMNEYDGWDLWRRWVLAHLKGVASGIVAGSLVGAVVGFASAFVCSYCWILVGPLAGWLVFAFALSWAQQRVLWPATALT